MPGDSAASRLILFSTEGFLLAVADGFDTVTDDSELYKLVANSIAQFDPSAIL